MLHCGTDLHKMRRDAVFLLITLCHHFDEEQAV